uniref:Uncharacterized protein n=1 Tax=Myoviridae sp. ctcwu24 TaxID=2826670 RepID=A0A8S5NIA9_9CAUD|nr:MAG TPA: hypothetical protein [Myoviridae sp. ctcwu24]DAI19940.1 MAG TPA: hypothetical protein [Caudoviricetes sp.]
MSRIQRFLRLCSLYSIIQKPSSGFRSQFEQGGVV